MNRQTVFTLAAVTALFGVPEFGMSATRSPHNHILVCHASNPTKAFSKAIPIKAPAVPHHLAHNDCLISGAARPGTVCDRSDPDGDGICGFDGRTCGDGAGGGGTDDHCACGDTVVTDTVLDPVLDPVASTACAGDGLILAADVRLDLNGVTVTGTDSGNGISVPNGGTVIGGTVAGFGVGIRVAAGAPGAIVTVAGTTIEGNAAEGALIDVADSQSRVVFENVNVQGNGGDGIHVRGAPGASNLDDGTVALDAEDYGFVMIGTNSQVLNNGGHGIHLGDPTQSADVAAFFDLGTVNDNVGAGILMEQKAGLAPGTDCGASAGYPGCTGATFHGMIIHDNGAAGVELHTSFIMPRKVGGTLYGLGFTSNKVFHNAMSSTGCSAVQTQPQVKVAGPVGLGETACTAATNQEACEGTNSPVNQHCYWTGSTCVVTWDLRGAQDCDDNTANPNQIHSYNTDTDPTGSSELSVGLYASDGAFVWADNNSWRTGDESQNVDQDASSFVDADTICPAGGILLQCSSF